MENLCDTNLAYNKSCKNGGGKTVSTKKLRQRNGEKYKEKLEIERLKLVNHGEKIKTQRVLEHRQGCGYADKKETNNIKKQQEHNSKKRERKRNIGVAGIASNIEYPMSDQTKRDSKNYKESDGCSKTKKLTATRAASGNSSSKLENGVDENSKSTSIQVRNAKIYDTQQKITEDIKHVTGKRQRLVKTVAKENKTEEINENKAAGMKKTTTMKEKTTQENPAVNIRYSSRLTDKLQPTSVSVKKNEQVTKVKFNNSKKNQTLIAPVKHAESVSDEFLKVKKSASCEPTISSSKIGHRDNNQVVDSALWESLDDENKLKLQGLWYEPGCDQNYLDLNSEVASDDASKEFFEQLCEITHSVSYNVLNDSGFDISSDD